MSDDFTLIYGTDERALTRAIFDEMVQKSGEWPDDRAFLIVPERLKADLERRYLERDDARGLMMAEVLSFRRLALRLLSETGGLAAGTLTRAGKALLVQRILLSEGTSFRRFGRLATRPAFAAELVNVLGDFYRYGIRPEDLRAVTAAGDADAGPVTTDKLNDFARLLERLETMTHDLELTDQESHLDCLAERLEQTTLPPRLRFLRRAHIFMLGFGSERMLTGQENRLLRALSRHVRGMTCAVMADGPDGDEPAFELGRRTLRRLASDLEGTPCFRSIPSDRPEPLRRLCLMKDSRDELEFMAGSLRRRLQSGAYRRRDLAVAVCGHDEAVIEQLLAVSETYGLDVYVDHRSPLMRASCLRSIAALLELSAYADDLDAVMAWLRGGLTGLDSCDIDCFENVCLAHGLIEAGRLRRLRDESSLDRLTETLAATEADGVRRVAAQVNQIHDLIGRLRASRAANDKLNTLFDFLTNEPLCPTEDTFVDQIAARRAVLLAAGYADEAVRLTAAWNAFADFVDEARRLLSGTTASSRDFAHLLLAAMNALVLSSIPIGIDRIRVGPFEQMVHYPCRVLWVLNATADNFPPAPPAEGFLRDGEREWFARRSGIEWPSGSETFMVAQSLRRYLMTQAATEELVVSAPTESNDELSRFLQEWREDDRVITEQPGEGMTPDARWTIPSYVDRALAFGAEASATWREAIRLLRRETIPERALPASRRDLRLVPGEDRLTMPTRLSISAIQTYNGCPFRYFLDYGLRLTERDIARDDHSRQGLLLHRMMELGLRDLMMRLAACADDTARRRVLTDWHDGLGTAYGAALYREAAADGPFRWYRRADHAGAAGERLARHVLTLLDVTSGLALTREDPYYPAALEWAFPQQAAHRPYTLPVDGAEVTLRGLIDRVDVSADAARFRLIDYKRSARSDRRTALELFDGTDIQLPLYRRAWQTDHPETTPAGAILLPFESRFVRDTVRYSRPHFDTRAFAEDVSKALRDKDPTTLEIESAYAEHVAVRAILGMRAGHFSAEPCVRSEKEGQSACRFCDYRGICYHDTERDRVRPSLTAREARQAMREMVDAAR